VIAVDAGEAIEAAAVERTSASGLRRGDRALNLSFSDLESSNSLRRPGAAGPASQPVVDRCFRATLLRVVCT
jgi:hypothetical protein